jgi:hypothetical protein
MRWKIKNLNTFLKLISAIVLLVGLGSSIYVYQTAQDYLNGVVGYKIIGGTAYPIMHQETP